MSSNWVYFLGWHVVLGGMSSHGARRLMGHVVSWGMSSHGAYCLWGILSLGHEVSGGILSLGHIVSGGILSWGIMSWGISSWRQIVLEAFCLGAYRLGAFRLGACRLGACRLTPHNITTLQFKGWYFFLQINCNWLLWRNMKLCWCWCWHDVIGKKLIGRGGGISIRVATNKDVLAFFPVIILLFFHVHLCLFCLRHFPFS